MNRSSLHFETQPNNSLLLLLPYSPIPVIQVHDVEFADLNIVLTQTLPTLDALRTEGKVRFIGITAYPLEVLK